MSLRNMFFKKPAQADKTAKVESKEVVQVNRGTLAQLVAPQPQQPTAAQQLASEEAQMFVRYGKSSY